MISWITSSYIIEALAITNHFYRKNNLLFDKESEQSDITLKSN